MNKVLIGIMLFCIGCSKNQSNDCLQSLGDVTETTISLQEFTKVYVDDRIEVNLVYDTTASVATLTCPENLASQIEFSYDNNQLSIRNTNTCNFVRSFDYKIVVDLPVNVLTELRGESVAVIRSKDTIPVYDLSIYNVTLSEFDLTLKVENEVYVQSLRSSKTILRGKAYAIKGSIEEISDLDARNLVCNEVLINFHSPLDSYINGTEVLYIKIYNSGNAFYMQEPSRYKDLNVREGTGNLILYK